MVNTFAELFELEKDGNTAGVILTKEFRRKARFKGCSIVVYNMEANTPATPSGHKWPQRPKYVTIFTKAGAEYIQAMYFGKKTLLYKVTGRSTW